MQEALVDAVRVWPDEPPRDAKGWLVTVAWRKFLDAARAEAVGEADGPRAGVAALAALDPALPRHAAATAYLHERR